MRPPKLATKILLSFLRDDLAEEVIGDLEEKFVYQVKQRSLFKARLNYWYQVINYCRPFAIQKSGLRSFTNFAMFQNYYTIAFRNLLRQKLYSVINIGGLSIGLACFLIMMLYVQHELSYDNFYPNSDRLYRVYQKQEGNVFKGSDYFAVTPAALATAMRDEIPEVKQATSVNQSSGLIAFEKENWLESGLAGDEQFFNVLPIPFVSGDPKTALKEPKSIVLTESLAAKIFGTKDPIGQTLTYQEKDGFTVTGIIADAPLNSSLKYSFIVSILYDIYWVEQLKDPHWHSNSYYTYFELAEGAQPAAVETKFPAILRKHSRPGGAWTDKYFVNRVSDMYFHSNINFDVGIKGNEKAVYIFLAVAIIILLLACVNYMNLAIARSIKRSREVGLRKVVGAVRSQLITQFLGESVLIALISLVLAIGLTFLVIPHFGRMMERPVDLNILSTPWLLPALLGLVLIVGFFAGSYPALIMSGLRPVDVLKTKLNVKMSGFKVQHMLIVVQFAASIILVISSIVIYRQLQFIQNKELGFDKENIITIQIKDPALKKKFPALSNTWLENPKIISATLSSNLPTNISSSNRITKEKDSKDGITIYQLVTEYNFFDVFQVELIAGRKFSPDHPDDIGKSLIINETAAKTLGWSTQEAVGRVVYRGEHKTIVGVVKDFHMHSMHLPIQPLLIELSPEWGNFFSLKLRPENIQETIAFISKTIRNESAYPFQYEFLDDNYKKLYNSEQKLGEIFGFFAIVTIVIASLGLFGLAAFLSDQRTKEVGIRKVLGASVQSILFLLSKDFLSLVIIAFIISIPVGWYTMHTWLQEFAYRIEMEAWMFFIAGALAVLIAKLSVGYQSLKASMANPVDSLRSE